MELFHNQKEIKFFEDLSLCALELEQMSSKYGLAEVAQLSVEYKKKVQEELSKYNNLLGKKVSGRRTYSGESFVGVIEKITHFNAYSKSVRVNVKYTSGGDYKYVGGFDGYALTQLTLI